MIGKTNGGSGGTALNFKVIDYASETDLLAATPAENSIGIIPVYKVTSWIFAADEPAEVAQGLVWIKTGTASAAAFNAVKKNGITVYPISAMQYVGGAWVDIMAKSYQDGKWIDWWNGELYKNGNEYTSVTGGWINHKVGYNTSRTKALTVTRGASSLTAAATSGSGSMITTKNKIDLSGRTELVFDGTIESLNGPWCYLGVWTDIGSSSEQNRVAKLEFAKGTHEGEQRLDVSALNESYYIGFLVDSAEIDMRSMEMR